jgi:hypothetical protein
VWSAMGFSLVRVLLVRGRRRAVFTCVRKILKFSSFVHR